MRPEPSVAIWRSRVMLAFNLNTVIWRRGVVLKRFLGRSWEKKLSIDCLDYLLVPLDLRQPLKCNESLVLKCILLKINKNKTFDTLIYRETIIFLGKINIFTNPDFLKQSASHRRLNEFGRVCKTILLLERLIVFTTVHSIMHGWRITKPCMTCIPDWVLH